MISDTIKKGIEKTIKKQAKMIGGEHGDIIKIFSVELAHAISNYLSGGKSETSLSPR